MSWQKFCSAYRIPTFKSSGRNVAVRCPLCGSRMLRPLMGLHLDSSAYRCFYDPSHSGRDPAKLIAAFLGMSEEDAIEVSKEFFKWSGVRAPVIEKEIGWVKKPEDFRPISMTKPHEAVYVKYLKKRGYDPAYVIPRFNLHYAVSGDFAQRIIIPVIEDDKWYTWTARAISENEPIRYKTAPSEYTKSVPNNHLFDHQNLTGGRLLVLCEGVFDAMKIASSFIAGVHATALFGKEMSAHQLQLVLALASKYERIALGLDADAYLDSVQISSQLEWYLAIEKISPSGSKDWGGMSVGEIRGVLI